jgi:HTH-type transcriptional regulator/antitoxin HigA
MRSHTSMRSVQSAALQSQLESLKEVAAEYQALRAGTLRRQRLESFGELPDALISGRIAAGLTQRQLADRLGLNVQQIRRYEATEYRSASMGRVSEVAAALGLRIRADVRLPRPGGRRSADSGRD